MSVVSWQSIDDLGTVGLTLHDVTSAAWFVAPDGTRLGGHLAIGAALRAVGGPWGLVGRAILTPPLRWLGGPVYRLVANNRHRLPGGTASCRIDPHS